MDRPELGAYRFVVVEHLRHGPVTQKAGPYMTYLTAARERKRWAWLNRQARYQVIETDDIETLLVHASLCTP